MSFEYKRGVYTLCDSSEAEKRVEKAVYLLRRYFEEFNLKEIKAVLLIGGYGKGEGGIQRVGDRLLPKNNLDILIIHNLKEGSFNQVESIVEKNKIQLEEMLGLSVDIGWMNEDYFKRSYGKLMTYDLKEGHKVLHKTPDFELNFSQVKIENVYRSEFIELMTNRGILLLLNEYLFRTKNYNENKVRIHIAKAIIALGDAFLYARGMYSWSYVEKKERMKDFDFSVPELSRLYQKASDYRFYDSMELFEGKSLQGLNQEIADAFSDFFPLIFNEINELKGKRRFSLKSFLGDSLRQYPLIEKAWGCFEVTSLLSRPRNIVDYKIAKNYRRAQVMRVDELRDVILSWGNLRDPNFFRNFSL